MIQYNDLSFMEKLKFKMLNPHTTLTAIDDYVNDKRLLTTTINKCIVKTYQKDNNHPFNEAQLMSERKCSIVFTIQWNKIVYTDMKDGNKPLIEVDVIGFSNSFYGSMSYNQLLNAFNSQQQSALILLNDRYNDDRYFRVVEVDCKQLDRVIKKFKWLQQHNVIEIGQYSHDQLRNDIPLQFQTINKLRIQDYFFQSIAWCSQ